MPTEKWKGMENLLLPFWSRRNTVVPQTLEIVGSVRTPQERGGNRKKCCFLQARRAPRYFLCWADSKSITHP